MRQVVTASRRDRRKYWWMICPPSSCLRGRKPSVWSRRWWRHLQQDYIRHWESDRSPDTEEYMYGELYLSFQFTDRYHRRYDCTSVLWDESTPVHEKWQVLSNHIMGFTNGWVPNSRSTHIKKLMGAYTSLIATVKFLFQIVEKFSMFTNKISCVHFYNCEALRGFNI